MTERMVSTQNLEVGMFVVSLDRPWLDTPFLVQGFPLDTDEDVAELRQYCKYVFIDPERGKEAACYLDEPSESNRHYLDEFLRHGERQVEYEDQKPVLQEFPAAERALDEASIRVARIMDNLKQGDNLDLGAVRASVQPMLDSVIRNVDALLWMLGAQEGDSLYRQATDNCVLGLAFGRHLGLYKEDLRTLAVGMLLLDIGKLRISPKILNKPGRLTRAEYTVVQKHVDFGVELLRMTPGLNETVVSIVQHHHERFDGSGYPAGLTGRNIPLLAMIAGIIDTYNAMTRHTAYRGAIAPHNVLQTMYQWRKRSFQGELIEQFLQCLGVYPTGSLVEMSSGEVGIVIAQNRRDRLKPTINMLLDEHKQAYEMTPLVDLSNDPLDNHGLPLRIMHALEPGTYGVDPSAVGLR